MFASKPSSSSRLPDLNVFEPDSQLVAGVQLQGEVPDSPDVVLNVYV